MSVSFAESQHEEEVVGKCFSEVKRIYVFIQKGPTKNQPKSYVT